MAEVLFFISMQHSSVQKQSAVQSAEKGNDKKGD